MFDANGFCRDYNVPTAPRHHKHHRRGWINVVCPFCSGNPGWHLGINIAGGYSSCHRCGEHWIVQTISALAGVFVSQAYDIAKQYTSGEDAARYEPRDYAEQLVLPPDVQPLTDNHRKYLQGRDFDPDELVALWDIKSIGRYGGQYKNRIYIPIVSGGRVISYTSRDVTGERSDKYRVCPEANEVYHHKFSLYGIDKARGDTAAVVEGVFDVWRWGPGAVGTMGSEFLVPQVALLAKRFRRVFIFRDPDSAGAASSQRLYQQLDVRNVDCEILYNDSGLDPGDTPHEEIQALKKELGI